MPRRFLALLLTLLAALLGVAPCPAQRGGQISGSYDRARERYDTTIRRLPFRFHTEGRTVLARSHDARAMLQLISDYRKPPAYPEHTHYTVGSLLGQFFDDAMSVDPLIDLRKRFHKREHAWLVARTLPGQIRRDGPAQALRVARTDKEPFLRAAAIEAFRLAGEPGGLVMIDEVCDSLPKKPGARRALIVAMSSYLLANEDRLDEETTKSAIHAFIELLGPEHKLSVSEKRLMLRHLRKIFDDNSHNANPAYWLDVLDRGKTKKRTSSDTTTAALRFFGMEADGNRIIYVIDMSDSMCKKIDESIKPKAAFTGLRKKRKKNVLPDESDLPWFKIVTRFDLAREHLKISLQRLSKDRRFSIVWFGTKAGTLKSCPRMIRGTSGNIKKVIKELDSIRVGSPRPPDHPDGVLRGSTNLHGGLRLAFSLTQRKPIAEHAYTDSRANAQGCDMIFLLSDGAPSIDDFVVKDRDFGEGKVVVHNEYARATKRTPFLWYHGPYVVPVPVYRGERSAHGWIVEDVRRMNVFRGAQIHCVGIGEANMRLLEQIAAGAMGSTHRFGAK